MLAAIGGVLPLLLLLLLGLSLRAIDSIGQRPMIVDFIPIPEPTPTPPEQAVKPQPRHLPGSAAPAPAPLVPPPAPVPVVPNPVAPAPAPPAMSALDGSGTASDGNGGTGGTGTSGRGSGGSTLVLASWAKVPGDRELMPYNPQRAQIEAVNGTVLLRCHVLRTKRVSKCRVTEESPPGYGFGDAALAASRDFRMNPPLRDGIPYEEAWIEVPVAFNNRR